MVHSALRLAIRCSARGGGRFVALAMVVVACGALPARQAQAFCRTTTCAVEKPPKNCERDMATGCWSAGIPLAWPQECVSFSVNTNASQRLGLGYDQALEIAQEAFAHWPLASCADGGQPSIAFMSLPGLTCDRVEFNGTGPNANAILFRDDTWTHSQDALALTTVFFNANTGQLRNADMEINVTNPEVSIEALPFIITHESGHFIGLDHAPDPQTVMYFQYNRLPGQSFALTDDDIAAVCDAYPPSRSVPATCDFQPPKGYAIDCGGDVQAACAVAPAPATDRGAWWWCALLALGAAVTFRWRRRADAKSPPPPTGS
jgi:hypothetical protein